MALCKCENLGLGNTGLPNCQPLMGVDSKIIMVPTINSDGVKNSYDASVELSQAVLDALINEADASKRWYPLPKMENQTSDRADSVTETSASGTIARVKSGVRTETLELWSQSPTLLRALEEAKCSDFSIFVIDDSGNLIGMCLDDTTNLYPVRIDKGSLDYKYVKATNTTVGKVQLSYQWLEIEKDSNLSMMTADTVTADAAGSTGLLDVNATYTAITTDGFTATLETIYGAKGALIKDQGLEVGDFALYNVTQDASITITSVTETAGVYVFVIPTQTSADVLRLTPTQNGRDYSAVVTNTITIP